MSDSTDIIIPDIGDFEDVEVIEVLVASGDTVAREDGLITLETDKATMDVPATADGVIESITVSVGDRVKSGDKIGTLKSSGGAAAEPQAAEQPKAAEPETTEEAPVAESGGEQTVTVPDIGDFDDVDVIEVLVSVGDTVAVEDALMTLETDKATMDVPSTVAGKVTAVHVSAGGKVSQGSPVVDIAASGATAPAKKPAAAPAKSAAAASPAPAEKAQPAPQPQAAAPKELPPIDEAGFSQAHASPSVRKLARELGVNLVQVKGSGEKSRVLHDDVKSFVKGVLSGKSAAPGGATALPKVPTVDFAKFGDVDVQKLTRIQKISGPRLQASWINLPHVTQHDLADITDLEARRQTLKGAAKERGISLTPLAFVIKACITALKEFPKVNSSLSADGESLVYKKYYHIGFAADTDQGLVVPVIRNADTMDVYELAAQLGELSKAARDGKLKGEQMQGASFTISSLGGIGGTAFTPIVNAPEVAILGVSKSSMQPVWNGEAFDPRLMLPVSFSYDHRVIDGAYAVRFTTFLSQTLNNVDALLEAIP